MKNRHVVYLTGSRADFGLMECSLRAIHAAPNLKLDILATGQQLSEKHGLTIRHVEATGLSVHRLDVVSMEGINGLEMSQSVALQMHSIAAALETLQPDLLIVLGDRGEMVAGALAAVYQGIAIAHFHGGERSGTVDDQFRRAISALAQIHFPATEYARQRLLKMGELDENIFLVGAPGLDEIRNFTPKASSRVRAELGLASEGHLFTCVFHPVVQDADLAAEQVSVLLDVLDQQEGDVIVIAPNSDAGSAQISAIYEAKRKSALKRKSPARFHWFTHLKRDCYLSLVAASDLLIGNSSSGIIEAASLGTVAVNVGDRQIFRDRNTSVFDCLPEAHDIASTITKALTYNGKFDNVYDAGGCATQLPGILSGLDLSRKLIKKRYEY